jgi:hypothetical protein
MAERLARHRDGPRGGAARDAAVEFEWRHENAVDLIGNQALVRPELRYVAAGSSTRQAQAGRAPS